MPKAAKSVRNFGLRERTPKRFRASSVFMQRKARRSAPTTTADIRECRSSTNREAQHQRVRERHGSHQRDRVVLGATQAWLPRYLPPHEREASRALCDRVRRTANVRGADTVDQMSHMASRMVGKWLSYRDLTE